MIQQIKQHKVRSNPEVLAPAGDLRSLKAAIDFGADAVYCGGDAFNMRLGAKNFSLDDLAEGLRYAHDRGARVYVTCNILPVNDEVEAMNQYFSDLVDLGVDACIVTDIGMLMQAHKTFPNMELHVSTQAGITNYQAASAFYELGAKRVVLARELNLETIRNIRANTPRDLDIECFVHGSMCMAFSGRCLISKHLTGRDANHGECAQSCRWNYAVVEEKRPGEYFPVETGEGGTLLFNSHDMNMLGHLDEVIDAGVTSLKIEGRAKGAYYVAAMANAYASAVDQYMVQRGFEDAEGAQLKPFSLEDSQSRKAVELPDWLLEEPYKVTHRSYSTGFYYRDKPVGEDIYRSGYINDWRIVGEVSSYDPETKRLYIYVRNKIEAGDQIEVLAPSLEPLSYTVPTEGLLDHRGEPVDCIAVPLREYSIPFDEPAVAGAMVRKKNIE